jgi:hypothetical protein
VERELFLVGDLERLHPLAGEGEPVRVAEHGVDEHEQRRAVLVARAGADPEARLPVRSHERGHLNKRGVR